MIREILLTTDVREKPVKLPFQTKTTQAPSTPSSNNTGAARRKFMAEASLHPRPITLTSDQQVEQDLANLSYGVPGAWNQLMADIGGVQNLSTYRTSQGFSLAELTGGFANGGAPLTNALSILLQNGFKFIDNDLSPRDQCDDNKGYCGEASLISAALANGEYISQYEARQLVFGNQTDNEILLNDGSAEKLAQMLGLTTDSWQPSQNSTTADYLNWLAGQVNSGHPVAIGVYMNMTKFGESGQGDSTYDHIVMVTGIDLTKGTITFSDNGLYNSDDSNDPTKAQYSFTESLYGPNGCVGTRQDANASNNWYTIPLFNNGIDPNQRNYGVAITGSTQHIHVFPSTTNEPDIGDGSNTIPNGKAMTLTGCVDGAVGKEITVNVYTSLDPNAPIAETITIPASANGVFSISQINGQPITTSSTVIFRTA